MEEEVVVNLRELFSKQLADVIEFDKEMDKAMREMQMLMSVVLTDYLLACSSAEEQPALTR